MDTDHDMISVDGQNVTDPPTDLDDVQQRDLPAELIPAVPVKVDGLVHAQMLPALESAVYQTDLDTTMRRVVDANPKRRAVTLVGADAWRIARTPTGLGALMPADVPIRLEHADRIYARASADTSTLSVIEEIWAD